jgi:uncharacterized protein (DUF1778 family)
MGKTITLRVDNAAYDILKNAAAGDRRNISNYIEYAALNYTLDKGFVDDAEMAWVLTHERELRRGLEDIRKGRYHFVD